MRRNSATCTHAGDRALTPATAGRNDRTDLEQRIAALTQANHEQQSPREQALLRHFLAARRSTAGIVVVSERLMLADPLAGRLLEGFDQPLLWERASRALTTSGTIDEELELANGHTLATSMTAIRDSGEVLGVMLQIRPLGRGRPAAKRAAPEPDEHRPGLVGDSAGCAQRSEPVVRPPFTASS